MSDPHQLPVVEFAFAGPLRDRLVAAILEGTKTTTASTLVEYEVDGEALPVVGTRQTVIDSGDVPVAVIEITAVEFVRLASVALQHALDEGEGYTTVAQWRSAHEAFWQSEAMRAHLCDPHFSMDDETLVVLERFRLLERL